MCTRPARAATIYLVANVLCNFLALFAGCSVYPDRNVAFADSTCDDLNCAGDSCATSCGSLMCGRTLNPTPDPKDRVLSRLSYRADPQPAIVNEPFPPELF
jgi:hypothetical protein